MECEHCQLREYLDHIVDRFSGWVGGHNIYYLKYLRAQELLVVTLGFAVDDQKY